VKRLTPLRWRGGRLELLDQLALPAKERWISCLTADDVREAIRKMNVRGAPAIGVSAAYGLVLAASESRRGGTPRLLANLERAGQRLKSARPTAVNLMWAVDRMLAKARSMANAKPGMMRKTLLAEARNIEAEDIRANKTIGRLGASLIRTRSNILTHCNTGALATAGYGTALGIIRSAFARRKVRMVFAGETRPYLQGARLTAWELKKERIPFTLITDSMAGHFMKQGLVDLVVVGADRITARGDVANKIGTYSLAQLARVHHLPFYVAAPTSTIDLRTASGSDIPIEERSSLEVLRVGSTMIAPRGTRAAHPAFDVTPAKLVTAIVTERGIARPPYSHSLRRLVGVK